MAIKMEKDLTKISPHKPGGLGELDEDFPLEEGDEGEDDDYDLLLYDICKKIAVLAKEIKQVQRLQRKMDKYIKQQERQEKQMLRRRKNDRKL